MHPLFAYGTLQDADLLAAVIGRVPHDIVLHTARLAGYAVEWAEGATYPIIVERPEAVADGLLLSGLTPADLARLDAYETALYRRSLCRVETDSGAVEAEVYWPTDRLSSSGAAWTLAGWQALRRVKAAGRRRE